MRNLLILAAFLAAVSLFSFSFVQVNTEPEKEQAKPMEEVGKIHWKYSIANKNPLLPAFSSETVKSVPYLGAG